MDFPLVPNNKVKLKPNGKSILILGGGLAGLQAGCELVDRGFKVTILRKNFLTWWETQILEGQIFRQKIFQR
jgi:heterodisulfide reductase subunit A-like polyferredoxin